MHNITTLPYDLLNTEKIDFLKQKYPEAVEKTIDQANKICNNELIPNTFWDMECFKKPIVFQDTIKWSEIKFKDKEWIYLLNRHKFWIILGQAYQLTNNELYSRTFFKQMKNWIEQNPLNETTEKTTWRYLETGIRCTVWSKCFFLFSKSKFFNQDIRELFMKSMNEHLKYLTENINNIRQTSNWYMFALQGLYFVNILFPEIAKQSLFLRDYDNLCIQVLTKQFNEDGRHIERSNLYHNKVILCFLESMLLAKNNNLNYNPIIKEIIRKALQYSVITQKPGGFQIASGDSDELNIKDLLALAALVYNDQDLKYHASQKINFWNSWDIKTSDLSKYETLEKKEPEQKNLFLKSSGETIFRSSWKDDAIFLKITNDKVTCSHSHNDNLHIDMKAYNTDFLIDSGRATYVHSKLRSNLKSLFAHNSIILDNKDFVNFIGSWNIKKKDYEVINRFKKNDRIIESQSSHNAYSTKGNSITIERQISFIDNLFFIIIDQINSNKKHNVKTKFRTGELNYEIENGTIHLGKSSFLGIFSLKDNNELNVYKSYYSKKYNSISHCISFEYQTKINKQDQLIYILFPYEKNSKPTITSKLNNDKSLIIEVNAKEYSRQLCLKNNKVSIVE